MNGNYPDLESLFEAALEIQSVAERADFLDRTCKGNRQLRDEIQRLLDSDREAGSFLDAPAVTPASTMPNSVLEAFSRCIDDVPRVVLREQDADTVLRLGSPEIPKEQNAGRYQLHGEIARGGMGAIIRGRDTDLGRDLVVKVLLDKHKDKPEYVRRFIEEAQIGGQLQHPGIAPIFDIGRFDDERPFFSMKLVKGKTLAAFLESRQQGNDDHGKLLGIFEHICQTMAYAHSRGVIHRDLKPANVMVGPFGEVQVMDWGLAKVLGEGGTADEKKSIDKHNDVSVVRTVRSIGSDTGSGGGSETRLGSVMGTFAYMPPEQALGEVDRLDERADVFALGAILSEILTGKPPYVAKDNNVLHRLATRGSLETCFARLDDCEAEPEIVELAKACLSPEPEGRLRNAGVLAERFAQYQHGLQQKLRETELKKVASETKANEERRRRKLYVTICALLALIGTGALIAAGSLRSMYKNAETHRLRADEEAHHAKVRSLASESRAYQAARPSLSVLLAIEAVDLSQQDQRSLMPIAHEALLNSTQALGGRPLRGHSQISEMHMGENRLITHGDGTVRIWDLRSGNPHLSPAALGNESKDIHSIALSQNGRWLVTAGKSLQRWDLEGQIRDPQILAEGSDAVSMALGPNGRWLVAQSLDGTVRRWDCGVSALEAPHILHKGPERWNHILVSPDGRWVALQQGQFKFRLLNVDTETTKPIEIELRDDVIYTVSMSDDGHWLAIGDKKGARLFDLHTLISKDLTESSRDLPTPLKKAAITDLLFTQDSRWLFGWHGQFTSILRWDLAAPDQPPLLRNGDESGVPCLAVSQDGQRIAAGGVSGEVHILEMSNGDSSTASRILKTHDWLVDVIAMHPQGQWMATAAGDGTARLWKLDIAHPTSSPFVWRGQDDAPYTVAATSSDGRWIVTKVQGNAVELWDTSRPHAPPRLLQGHQERVWSIGFGHGDRWLLTHSEDSTQVWDLTKSDPAVDARVLQGIASVVVSHGYDKLAAVYDDKTIRLLDLDEEDPEDECQIIGNHELNVTDVTRMAVSRDSRWLVVACQTTVPSVTVEFRVWDLQSPDIKASCRLLDGQRQFLHGNGLAIDATSRWLVTAGGWSENHNSDEETVRIWDLHDLEAEPRVIKKKGDVFQVAVSPGGRWLFTSRYTREAQLWELSNDETPHELLQGTGQSVAISPNGRWLAAGGRVHFDTLLYDLEASEPWKSPRVLRGHEASVWQVAFSEDNRWLVTDSSDGTVRRWCLDEDWLLDYARKSVSRELSQIERERFEISDRSGISSGSTARQGGD